MSDEFDFLDEAQNIVDNQDGETVARILNDYGDSRVVYEGDSIWAVDDIGFDDHEIVSFVGDLLIDVDPVLRAQIVADYA